MVIAPAADAAKQEENKERAASRYLVKNRPTAQESRFDEELLN